MSVKELLEQYAAGLRDFNSVDLSEANLSGAKLSGVNFSHANLNVVNLSGAHLMFANFSHAKLNVARLSGANLDSANLNHASLNVANLIRADLSRAQLKKASLIRAELIRADLSHANLLEANIRGADLREATLRHAILQGANLSDATLRDGFLTGANLEQAHLNNTDLNSTDLSGANLRDAELKQANLNRANLSGANLSRANLRWADLSGANLSWADLSEAKLSGANLMGADLSNANLTNASFVHANLTQAKLINADWVGADLTKAILTGAKLYATSRFGLKTDGMICEWLDLSPLGDRSIIQNFASIESREFFNETPPTIRIIIDRPLNHEANFAIAGAYYQIAQQYRELKQPPSVEIGRRRTVFTFRLERDERLFPAAYMAILPFQDASTTQQNICTVLSMIETVDIDKLAFKGSERLKHLNSLLEQAINHTMAIKNNKIIFDIAAKLNFFQARTQTILTNSSAQNFILHAHPNFGQKINHPHDKNTSFYADSSEEINFLIPSLSILVDFVKGFHYINQ